MTDFMYNSVLMCSVSCFFFYFIALNIINELSHFLLKYENWTNSIIDLFQFKIG